MVRAPAAFKVGRVDEPLHIFCLRRVGGALGYDALRGRDVVTGEKSAIRAICLNLSADQSNPVCLFLPFQADSFLKVSIMM